MRSFGAALAVWVLAGCATIQSQSGMGILKVLPHYLDEKGRHTDGPTLLHRDSYQNKLRNNPQLARSMRYDINWYGVGEVTLRLELRSNKSGLQPITLEQTVDSGAGPRHWSSIEIVHDTYLEFGQPYSWRVSLWRGEEMLDQDQSFLW
jgi:hypothetical protein